ncbi:embryonic protein UVS.2-like [Penaeus japonicus]|uniref:embryonic protein UVS.2-like n=1 Tax=Penaeus japonicus TaxID=27405 RepID=UPI001C712C39|nr:embryonic protein UVS.2-like [Penaeus japonicus]
MAFFLSVPSTFTEIDADSVDADSTVPCSSWVWMPTGSNVTFTSPNYPDNYGWKDCSWVFFASNSGAEVQIDCSDFELQGRFWGMCLFDVLSIKFDILDIKKFCSTDGPQNELSTAQWAIVKFRADFYNHFKGFKCTATAVNSTTT